MSNLQTERRESPYATSYLVIRSSFAIICAVLPIPGHLIVPDCFCPRRGIHTRDSETVPGIAGQLVTLWVGLIP